MRSAFTARGKAAVTFGGFVQFFVIWLIQATGSPIAPAFYVMFGAAMGLVAAPRPGRVGGVLPDPSRRKPFLSAAIRAHGAGNLGGTAGVPLRRGGSRVTD